MTLPVLSKTWQFSVNNKITYQYYGDWQWARQDAVQIVARIVRTLITMPSSPWVVVGSSNGTNYSMDGYNWWFGLIGSDTSATVNTSTNKTLRIRASTNVVYTTINVTSGASTAKTTIRDDLNAAFVSNSLPLIASVNYLNKLVIDSTDGSGYVQVDATANGSNLNTAVGFPSYYTCTSYGSSNSYGASNLDNTLNWNSSGSAHSWIVLRQAGINGTFELCLDLNGYYYDSDRMTVVVSGTGFTGGSLTARPTATDEYVYITSSNQWLDNRDSGTKRVVHIMQSTDGECTRIVVSRDDAPVVFWLFDKPKNPVSGWTKPYILIIGRANTGASAMSYGYNDGGYVGARINSINLVLYMSFEGYGDRTLVEWPKFQRTNQLTGENYMFAPGLVSETVGAKGRHGEVYDLWFGNPVAQSLGGWSDIVYPETGERTFWQSDDIILPWVGSVDPDAPLPIMRF